MNLPTAFADSVAKNARKTAIFWGDAEFTYQTLFDQALRLAAHLQQHLGVRPGDRVGLWLKNCPEFVPALFGPLRAGAAVVPINNFLKPGEVNYILADAGIDVLITDASMAEALPRLSAARPQLKVWQVEDMTRLPEDSSSQISGSRFPESAEADLALLIYTSGTTGHPKGAMLSHGNLLHNVESCRQVLAAVSHDRFAGVLPMFHSFMLTVSVLLPLLVGGSIVLVRALHPPKNVILEMLQHGATILPAVPAFFRMLAHAGLPEKQPLRLCISGGAALPVEVLREFNAKMPVPLIEGYGLSEASPVVSLNPLAGPWKEGSIGVPIPNVEVTVQDDQGNLLPDGVTGEVCVRGGNVMSGYWNQPEETARALRNGWLLTGDVGHRDASGYFYITDRKKDMLIVNGNNVYPREIEEVIYQIPGVKEAAVVGMPDPRKGEQPVAFVAPVDGTVIDEKAVVQFVRERLADYKVPRHVHFMACLPRNATGKILKTTLRGQVTPAGGA
jgi:long-chain acyl-CoA synthetase